ncbi:hypothetical protein Esti_005575 [Eimeria stiedai]
MRASFRRSWLLAAAAAALCSCVVFAASSGEQQQQQQQHEDQQQQQQQQHEHVDCAALERSKLVPDVLRVRECKTLHLQLRVSFEGHPAEFGNELSKSLTQKPPRVLVSAKPSTNTQYVLVLTDPDAPSRDQPVYREWAHWVAVSDSDQFDENSPSPLSYRGPSPPKDTGLHRYVLLLFVASLDQQQQQQKHLLQQQQQEPKVQVSLQHVPGSSSRSRWGGIGRAMAFAAANHLQLAGVQWFTVQY